MTNRYYTKEMKQMYGRSYISKQEKDDGLKSIENKYRLKSKEIEERYRRITEPIMESLQKYESMYKIPVIGEVIRFFTRSEYRFIYKRGLMFCNQMDDELRENRKNMKREVDDFLSMVSFSNSEYLHVTPYQGTWFCKHFKQFSYCPDMYDTIDKCRGCVYYDRSDEEAAELCPDLKSSNQNL